MPFFIYRRFGNRLNVCIPGTTGVQIYCRFSIQPYVLQTHLFESSHNFTENAVVVSIFYIQ